MSRSKYKSKGSTESQIRRTQGDFYNSQQRRLHNTLFNQGSAESKHHKQMSANDKLSYQMWLAEWLFYQTRLNEVQPHKNSTNRRKGNLYSSSSFNGYFTLFALCLLLVDLPINVRAESKWPLFSKICRKPNLLSGNRPQDIRIVFYKGGLTTFEYSQLESKLTELSKQDKNKINQKVIRLNQWAEIYNKKDFTEFYKWRDSVIHKVEDLSKRLEIQFFSLKEELTTDDEQTEQFLYAFNAVKNIRIRMLRAELIEEYKKPVFCGEFQTVAIAKLLIKSSNENQPLKIQEFTASTPLASHVWLVLDSNLDDFAIENSKRMVAKKFEELQKGLICDGWNKDPKSGYSAFHRVSKNKDSTYTKEAGWDTLIAETFSLNIPTNKLPPSIVQLVDTLLSEVGLKRYQNENTKQSVYTFSL